MIFRKVLTIEELDEALEATENHPGSKDLYIQESLLAVVKQRWEEMHNRLVQAR